MGTGSFSVSPSDTGGAMGSSYFSSLGSGANESLDKKQKKVFDDTEELLKKLASNATFISRFESPILQHAFKSLFDLSINVFQNKSWNGIEKKYNIPPGAGCLRQWVASVLDEVKNDSPGNRMMAKSIMDSFLIKALRNNHTIFRNGTANEVMDKLQRKLFDSTTGYFFGYTLAYSIKGQIKGINVADEDMVQKACEKQGDKIIKSFENTFKDKPYPAAGIAQVTRENLFEIIAHEKEWFKKEIKK